MTYWLYFRVKGMDIVHFSHLKCNPFMGKQTELTLHLPQGPVQACGCRCLRTMPLHWTANLVQIQGRYWTKMNQLAREYKKINCQTICILLQFYSRKKIIFFFFSPRRIQNRHEMPKRIPRVGNINWKESGPSNHTLGIWKGKQEIIWE